MCLIDTLLFCKYSSHFRSLGKPKRKPLWTHWLYCVRTILQVEKTTQISIQRGYLQNGKWNKNQLLELVPNILRMFVVKFNQYSHKFVIIENIACILIKVNNGKMQCVVEGCQRLQDRKQNVLILLVIANYKTVCVL